MSDLYYGSCLCQCLHQLHSVLSSQTLEKSRKFIVRDMSQNVENDVKEIWNFKLKARETSGNFRMDLFNCCEMQNGFQLAFHIIVMAG